MSKYRTCVGCLFEGQACGERDRLRAKCRGLGITSMKWKCSWRRPKFRPGDLLNVSIVTRWEPMDDAGRSGFTSDTFPGIFIQTTSAPSKAIVFIRPGEIGVHGEEFTPAKDGNGFCRLSMAYMSPREGVPEHVCIGCGNPTSVLGHADYCNHGRH